MKIGIQSNIYTDVYGFERGFFKMKEHGYDCADIQTLINVDSETFRLPEAGFEDELSSQRKAAESAGIEIIQAHGPWGGSADDLTEELRKIKYENVKKAIRGCAYLGCKNFVIHNLMPFGDSDAGSKAAVYEINTEFYTKAAEYAEEFGVVICLENMPFRQYMAKPADMLAFVKSLGRDNVRMCLDTGHAAVHNVPSGEAVRLIGKEYLYALHVHDNNGISDLHQLPYTGVIDWEDFSKALYDIGFEGCVSLETGVPGNIPAGEEREELEIKTANIAKRIARLP